MGIKLGAACMPSKHTSNRATAPGLSCSKLVFGICSLQMGRAKRICYLSPMRAAKVQASLRIRAVSPEPSLLAHTSSESRGTFRQKARSLAPLNGWACAVKVCHDGMLEDTNSLGAAQILLMQSLKWSPLQVCIYSVLKLFRMHSKHGSWKIFSTSICFDYSP